MPEGSETPDGQQGIGPEGRLPPANPGIRSEGDLFAERRARRASESGEVVLMRRAEAAEATVHTLERHVASLQQRVREAEEDRVRLDELLDDERASALDREHELRSVKQREYAEQQLRVEAEERLLALERESAAEIERLSTRLAASEHDARELAQRLDGLQHELSEAERAAADERVAALADRRSGELRSTGDQQMQQRLSDLERRALEIQRGLDAERAARERSERALQSMREGHRRMESLLGEMRTILARVTAALDDGGEHPPVVTEALAPGARGADMADALAAAVERLRARAETAPAPPDGVAVQAAPAAPATSEGAAAQTAPAAPARAADGAVELPRHKHSLSWFARRRIKRKQRRARRGQ
jgi:DNA repair exonuclease SbcCD ATPase subunit